ncbi:ATPase domain-containing protein [Robertmurraya sp. FSL W8-0741]|uniref:ATPase domain-containing protein n=1 Tax=Robertmurraya TaxID=2837507 RepID=UPI000BA7AC74|nr:ATPase domain-containing protein [Robertmurraya siralis]PAE20597.1 circadian clock protein KaiC [Bacillus sp. 7504-2]
MSQYTSTGIHGLDFLLNGGFPAGASILIEGLPGTGKTNLSMQFLYNGAVQYDEPGIYITFEELPGQLYKEMKAFGWDIPALERENKLRVLCISPQVLLEQMERQNGLFEQMIQEMDCKRIVIDSISLFQIGDDSVEIKRKTLYKLRNILRKFNLTALLIQEQTAAIDPEVSYINYVVDGVIRLSLKDFKEHYRQRTLEVLKMRGRKIVEGEHIYRITDEGIQLLPAFSMVEDKSHLYESNTVTTGIAKLDQLLDGGIPHGSAFIIDTNSKANYKYLAASIAVNRLLAGESLIILLSSLSTINDIEFLYELYGVNLKEYVEKKKIFFIEHYNRPSPPGFEGAIIDVSNLDNDEYRKIIVNGLEPFTHSTLNPEEKWFVYYDLNTIVSQRGKAFLETFYAEEISRLNSAGFSVLSLSNFTELGPQLSSFVERTSNGVIKTWVEGSYQYVQLLKSPLGKMSSPLLVENINKKPFINLI